MITERSDSTGELASLRSGFNDILGVLALGPVWAGAEPSVVATTLLDALVQMQGLEFGYARLGEMNGKRPAEWARFGDGSKPTLSPQELGDALEPILSSEASELRIANPMGDGNVSVVVLCAGMADCASVFVVGSTRSGFPTAAEMLVLRVGANQAAIALRQTRRATRLQSTAEELDDHLRQLADRIPEVIWISTLGPEERIVYTSPSFERVWGRSLEELYRNPRLWAEGIHPEDRTRVVENYSRWIAGAAPAYENEFRIVRPDGSIRWVHEHGVLSIDSQGRPQHASGISTDITERKQAQQELERAFAEIQTLKDRLQQENLALREEVEKTSMFEEIVGVSEPLRAVLAQVSRVAPTESTVLITGETGTGKELVARAIHKLSLRSSRALINVNCAAIPPSLIASELFGHEKGAFTGALQRRQGRFELADGGTIFLDEVGELPAETQMALLRVLQEREFERVGGSRPIRTDVRVIAASNRDLESAVARNLFRADLYYRLNVFPLKLPPLRDRPEDVLVLVEYFIHRLARRAGKNIHGVHKASLDVLRAYPWPGNVRELQNVVERAVILCEGETLSIDETWLRPTTRPVSRSEWDRTSSEIEKELIERALADSHGRVSGPHGAAVMLGVPRSTLESRIRSLQISKYRFKAG